MKRFFTQLCIVLILTLLCNGCSTIELSTLFMSDSERSEYLHASPRFWNQAVAVEGSFNLYELQNDTFLRKPYNDLANFGDNILLIGEARYGSILNLDFDSDSSQAPYEFSFDVYSPWSNRIIASLEHNEISCTSYQICGDKLLLFNADTFQMFIYDANLKQLGTYDILSLGEVESLSFYAAACQNQLYLFNEETECLSRVQLTADTCIAEPLDLPYYDISIDEKNSTPDELVLTGVHMELLQDMVITLDTSTGTVTNEFSKNDYSSNQSYIMTQETNIDSVDSHYFSTYTYYDKNGHGISTFCYDCGDYSSANSFVYLGSNIALFEEQKLCFLLAYSSNCTPYLLVWDLAVPVTGIADLASPEDISPDRTDTSAKEPSGIAARVQALEDMYGIQIYFGSEVPKTLDIYKVTPETDEKIISEALDKLSAVLKCYPENFFEQLCFGDTVGIKIYLAGTIASETEGMLHTPTGFMNSIDNYLVMALCMEYCWDWDYTINHELSHMIDRRLEYRVEYIPDSLFSEETWASFNPDGCEYLNTYENYEENEDYKLYSGYFADAYGMTYPTEDRAELFGLAMSDYLGGFEEDPFFPEDGPTTQKYRYYCECIRDGFDTTGWNTIMPWEEILY